MPLKIANVITSFNSASGGPPRTVSLIAQAGLGLWLAELFTTDARASAVDSLLTDEFPGRVTLLPANTVRPLRAGLMSFGLVRAHEAQLLRGGPPDVLHIHGIWSLFLHAFARTAIRNGIPYILTPHGMLEPWSLSKRAWRKSLALASYQGAILSRAAAIHATSETEAAHIRRLPAVRAPIFVIPNAVDVPGNTLSAPERSQFKPQAAPASKVLLFLSRIHQKKGLDILLQAWNRVRPRAWTLRIAGAGDPAYLQQLKRYCRTENVPGVEFVGHVDGYAREAEFRAAWALVLPTYSENFGNVVAEAMVRGLPVLTTTGTPWSVVSEQKLGWYFEPKADALIGVLRALEATAPTELRAMGERGRAYALATLSNSAVRGRFMHMYTSVVHQKILRHGGFSA